MTTATEAQRYYLYCVISANATKQFGNIGIGGKGGEVYTIDYRDIAAVVSNTSEDKFESTEANILAHQRVVQRVFEKHLGIPLPFASMTRNREEVEELLEDRYAEFKDKLSKLSVLNENGSHAEQNYEGVRGAIEEALFQSASSAIKIRQMSDEIRELRSQRYEKTMEVAAEAVAKKFSAEFLASMTSLSQTIDRLQERVEKLQADLSRPSTVRDQNWPILSEVPSLDNEVRNLRREMERLNQRSFEDEVLAKAILLGDRDTRRA